MEHLSAHARSGVQDLEGRMAAIHACPHGNRSVPANGVDGVEEHIDEHLAQFGFIAGHRVEPAGLGLDFNGLVVGERLILPSRLSQGDRALDEEVQVHRLERLGRVALAIELPHPPNKDGGVLRGRVDEVKIPLDLFLVVHLLRTHEQHSVNPRMVESALLKSCAIPLAICPSALSRSC